MVHTLFTFMRLIDHVKRCLLFLPMRRTSNEKSISWECRLDSQKSPWYDTKKLTGPSCVATHKPVSWFAKTPLPIVS
jgi:hypothetical protein